MIDTDWERQAERDAQLMSLGCEPLWTFPPLCGTCAAADRVYCPHEAELERLREEALAREDALLERKMQELDEVERLIDACDRGAARIVNHTLKIEGSSVIVEPFTGTFVQMESYMDVDLSGVDPETGRRSNMASIRLVRPDEVPPAPRRRPRWEDDCQQGGDLCRRGRATGITCPGDDSEGGNSCDIDDGIFPDPGPQEKDKAGGET